MSKPPTRVVYTALIGGYEDLVEQPVAADSETPFVCFTDDASLTSRTWEIRQIKTVFPGDPVRSARAVKICGNEYVDRFDESLWIDNTVQLRVDPTVILDEWLREADFSLPQHSFRRQVIDEFELIVRFEGDDRTRVMEQLAHYTEQLPDLLLRPVLWTAILARRKSPLVETTMRIWLDHVFRYSRRDQLSIVHAIASSGIPFKMIPLDNHDSNLHSWPHQTRRMARPPTGDTLHRFQSTTALVGHLSNSIDEITSQFNASMNAREAEIARLQNLLCDHERAVEAMRRSRSWRVSYPLRMGGQVARSLRRVVRRLKK